MPPDGVSAAPALTPFSTLMLHEHLFAFWERSERKSTMSRNQSILAATLGTVTLVAIFSLTGGTVANAAAPGSNSPDPSTASCWVDVSTQQSLCVGAGDDLIAAVHAKDGITLSVPAGTRIGGATVSAGRAAAALLVPASAQVDTVVSAIYDDVNYGGGNLVLSAPSAGCGWYISNLSTYGWNDRASSFKSFAGCKTALWQNINFGGTHIGYATNDASFGSFNDQASSWHTD